MHRDSAVVFDITELAELGHELIDARARGADHARQRLLRDGYVYNVRMLAGLSIRQCQQNARQTLFAGIE